MISSKLAMGSMPHDFFKTGHGIYKGVVCPDSAQMT